MPSTIQRGTSYSVPVSLGGSIPGDAATGHVQRDVARFVTDLYEQEFPFLNEMMRRGRSTRPSGLKGNQYKAEWGSEGFLPGFARLNGAITSGAATLAVTTGQGVRGQVAQRIAVYDVDAQSGVGGNPVLPDWDTKEEMRITDISTDTFTVERAQAGTSARAFSDQAYIQFLSTALGEDDDFTIGPNVFGEFYFNYYQERAIKARVTIQANNTGNWEYTEREMARKMARNGIEVKRQIDRELFQGGKQAPNLSTGVKPMMGGFLSFVPSANTFDLADAKIGPYDVETAGVTLWESVAGKGAKRLFMNMTTARFFDGLMNKYKMAGMNDTSVDLRVMEFTTRVGTYRIEPTRNLLPGLVLGVNLDYAHLIPFEGMDWDEKDHATDGAYLERSIFGNHTLVVEAPETMFLLKNMNLDLNAYGRVF